jgi:hypothetical protein
MRTDKELLELLLEHYQSSPSVMYICKKLYYMQQLSFIELDEYNRLRDIVHADCKRTESDELSLDGHCESHPSMNTFARIRFRIDWLKSKIAAL